MLPAIPSDPGCHLNIYGYIKNIQPLSADAFICDYNRSETGSGKMWRKLIAVPSDRQGADWKALAAVAKVNSYRGSFKVDIYVPGIAIMEGWFQTEKQANEYLVHLWRFYDENLKTQP